MATFAGLHLSPSLLAFKGNQSVNLDTVRDLADRTKGFKSSSAKAGSVKTIGAPVSHIPQTHNGLSTGSLALNFYNRLWLAPQHLDLGNLVSEQWIAFGLWNAYFAPRPLNAITADNAEGLALHGITAPQSLFALQEISAHVQASLAGPPVIDGAFTFQVTGEAPLALSVVGKRIIAFTFAPNWQRGIREAFEWHTQILASEQGHEQRRALRACPRRSVSADFLIEGSERRRFEVMLRQWGARIWALPVWMDAQYLTADLPAGSAFIPAAPIGFNQQALLRQSATDYEVVTLAGMGASGLDLTRPTVHAWPRGTALIPLFGAMLQKPPAITRKSDALWQMEADFLQTELCELPASATLPLYRGLPVLDIAPDESEDLTLSLERITKLLDNQSALPQLVDYARRAFFVQSHRFICENRDTRRALLALFNALAGKQAPFWLPTFAEDLKALQPIAASAFHIDIEAIDLARFFEPRALRVELQDGTLVYRTMQSASALNDESERVMLDSPLGVTANTDAIRRISYLNLVRSDSDVLVLQHETDALATAKAVFKEVRDEL